MSICFWQDFYLLCTQFVFIIIGMFNKVRYFFINIICGFVANKAARRRVRAIYCAWGAFRVWRIIRKDLGHKPHNIKFITGARGRNLVVSVDDKYIYKFPIAERGLNNLIVREELITSAMRKMTKIKIPKMTVLHIDGIYIRKYEFIRGVQIFDVPANDILSHIDILAPQIARFIYDCAVYDATELTNIKGTTDAPGFMRGWFHHDICDNFIFNPKTYKIIAMIDWEDAKFMDFSAYFDVPRARGAYELMQAVKDEYIKIYNSAAK